MRPLYGMAALALLVAAAIGPVGAAMPLVSFTIDDGFPASGGAGVFSDGDGDYFDYRIDPSESYLNWCVDAEPFSQGNLFVRLNRKLDGEAGTLRCDENPRPDNTNGVARQFVLTIASDAVCDQLADARTLLDVRDFNSIAWDATNGALPCSLAANDNPRIRLDTLYKSKAKATTVDFLTFNFGSTVSYEIQSDSAAPIVTVGNTKTVTYTGTYHLVKFEPGTRAKTVQPAFVMPVKMVFTQH